MTRRREISASAAVCCSHSRAAPQKKRGAATFRGPPIPRSLPPPSRKPLPAPTLPDVSAPLGSTGLRRTCLAPHDRRADARRRRSARRVPPKTMRRSLVTDAARRCGVSGCRETRLPREVLASVNPARSRDRMSRTLRRTRHSANSGGLAPLALARPRTRALLQQRRSSAVD
jgi:hypothetical protein